MVMVAVVVVEGVIIIIIIIIDDDGDDDKLSPRRLTKITKIQKHWLKGSAFISTVYRLSNLRSPLLCALR